MRAKTIAGLAAWIALAGCGGRTESPAVEDGQAIVGGSVAPAGSLPASVRLQEALCSGVMISPYHVLTAGHCVEREAGKPTFTGNRLRIVASHADALDQPLFYDMIVSARHIHPTWKAGFATTTDPDVVADAPGTSDLGMFVLKNALPMKPAALATTAPARGASLLLSGSGCTRFDGNSAGPLKMATLPIDRVEANKLLLGLGSDPGAGVCPGDSGGGLYVLGSDGKPRTDLLAAISSTLETSPDEAAPTKPIRSFVARVDVAQAASWIRETMALDFPHDPPRRSVAAAPVFADEELSTIETARKAADGSEKAVLDALAKTSPFGLLLTAERRAKLASELVAPAQEAVLADDLMRAFLKRELHYDASVLFSIEIQRMRPSAQADALRLIRFALSKEPKLAAMSAEQRAALATTILDNKGTMAESLIDAALGGRGG